MFILEMITILTMVGTICFLMEKFIMDNECDHNNPK
jgi:flagellar biogenesis protein FliO